MYRAKTFIRLLVAAAVVLAGVLAVSGQSESRQLEPSYQVSLQFVMGTNEGGKSELPANLAEIAKDLRNDFGFSNYRVAGTLFGRVGNNGNYEYKSVSNIFGQESTAGTPTFLEWTIAGMHSVPSDKGRAFEGSAFRFGARVPVMLPHDDGGKTSMAVSYENVGITAMHFGLADNTPTLIGTISLPGTPGTIFLVMTARTAD